MSAPRRVAVTGVGAVTTCGLGIDALWDGLLSPAPDGERRVHEWDPSPWYDSAKDARRHDRHTQFTMAAAAEAMADAGDLVDDPGRAGVMFATGVGGMATFEEQVGVQLSKGSRRVSPFLIPMMMPNAAGAAMSMRYGLQGPCETITTACAASTHSIGHAAALIRWDRCDVVVTGGAEAAMTDAGMAGFTNMTALSSSGRSMPFDARRDGFMITEGAVVVVLEEYDRAVARGAHVHGEVLGSASTADAHHITAPHPDGQGALACMRLAIEDGGLSPDDIIQINAHGTSTPLNDAAEAEAIAKMFGSPGPPVTSTKGVTGHGLGAAGAIEAAAVLLSMRHGLIPPTAGHECDDPALPALDLVVGAPRPWTPGPSLSNSFGFGGHNGCLVLGPGD